jgi:hypothetical protein
MVTSLMTISLVLSFRYLELGKPGAQKQEDFASLCNMLRDMRVNGAILRATGAGKSLRRMTKGGVSEAQKAASSLLKQVIDSWKHTIMGDRMPA